MTTNPPKLLQPKLVFVKSQVSFNLDTYTLEFKNRSVSPMGVFGLPWPPLSPKNHFGRGVQASLILNTPEPIQVQVPASLSRERTFRSDWMGLRFHPDDRVFRILKRAVELYGFSPINYQRKTPRIPVAPKIQTFPLKVLGILKEEGLTSSVPPIVFDVRNISLGGVLLTTENAHAFSIQLEDVISLYFEPRGPFAVQIHAEGQVCRILEETHLETGNVIRYLGFKFAAMDQENRRSYLALIKDVVGRISGTLRSDEGDIGES